MNVAAVVPAFNCKRHIANVIRSLNGQVSLIYIVDDACPQGTGAFVLQMGFLENVRVIQRQDNGGVGAAVKTGYEAALADGFDIVVKIDGDDQMDVNYLKPLIAPLLAGGADYAKGNRFFRLDSLRKMPKIRLFGNSVLTFMNKISTGYYSVMDPTNGYTAITAKALSEIELAKVHDRYFFETDMLFRLNLSRAVVKDVPMPVIYGDETSGLNPLKVIPQFFLGHFRIFLKRIFYNYILRDFSPGSVFLFFGVMFFIFGLAWSTYFWYRSFVLGTLASSGTVMIGGLSIIVGIQMLLQFIVYDFTNEPKK